jgi:hypothetical protein
MKNSLFGILIMLLASGSLMAQSKKEKQEKKLEQKNVAYEATKKLIESGSYIFDAERVTARSMGGISLNHMQNGITVKNSEVEVNLPYFGVVRSAGYNRNPGITFKGIPEKYSVEYVDKKRRSIIKIGVRSSTEYHDISLIVSSSGRTDVKVISSSRDNISYSGYLLPIKEGTNN